MRPRRGQQHSGLTCLCDNTFMLKMEAACSSRVLLSIFKITCCSNQIILTLRICYTFLGCNFLLIGQNIPGVHCHSCYEQWLMLYLMVLNFQPAEGCWRSASAKNIAFRAWWWAQGVCSAGDLLLWGDRKWTWVLHNTGASVACAAPASDSACWSWGPGGRGEVHWGTGYRLVAFLKF